MMFKINLAYFLVPLIFAVCLSVSPSHFRYGSYPIQTCAENTSYFGYCVDCETEVDCNNGVEGEIHYCTDETLACGVNKYFAACSDGSYVPDCICPDGENVKKPDPYDKSKYLVCTSGDRHIFQCPGEEVYNPDSQECYTPTTTTPSTTTESGCLGVNDIIKLNCTCYRYCFDDGTPYIDVCCDPGEIYDEISETCDFFYLFNCTGKEDGKYVDNHNCSVYYICVNDEIFATENCADGQYFNETTFTCSDSATTECNAIEDCGICPDDETFIKIDCLNYYECVVNKNSNDPKYVPEARTCPQGTCFSDVTGYCDF